MQLRGLSLDGFDLSPLLNIGVIQDTLTSSGAIPYWIELLIM